MEELKKLNGKDRVMPHIDEFLDGLPGEKLELGCGKNRRQGYLGVDRFDHPNVDINLDIDGVDLPFADNSFVVIRAIHVIEHIGDSIKIWNEMMRVLQPDSFMYIVVPHPGGSWFFQDPTHKSFYTEKTFTKYFNKEFVSQYSDYGFKYDSESICTFIHAPTFDKLSVHSLLQVKK